MLEVLICSQEELDDEKIERLAKDFAAKVPEQVFSPAEVLSFLLERKDSPSEATTNVDDWVVQAQDTGSQLKRDGSWVQDSGF